MNRRSRAASTRHIEKKIRFDESEIEVISEAAAMMNISPISYIAMAAVAAAGGDDAQALRNALVELMRSRNQVVKSGTLLNQIAARMNSGGEAPESLDWAIQVNRRAVERLEVLAELVHKQLVQSQ